MLPVLGGIWGWIRATWSAITRPGCASLGADRPGATPAGAERRARGPRPAPPRRDRSRALQVAAIRAAISSSVQPSRSASRRSSPVSPYRQRSQVPSAVRRPRSQVRQNGAVVEAITPDRGSVGQGESLGRGPVSRARPARSSRSAAPAARESPAGSPPDPSTTRLRHPRPCIR